MSGVRSRIALGPVSETVLGGSQRLETGHPRGQGKAHSVVRG